MFRYRCPHCAALIVAHERRAGQSSVCKGCFKPHPIPTDRALWLTAAGDRLHPPAPSEPVAIPEELARPAVADRDALAPIAAEIRRPEPLVDPLPEAVASVPSPVPPVAPELVPLPEPIPVPPSEPRAPRPVPRVTRPVPPVPAARVDRATVRAADAAVATATPPPAPGLPPRSRSLPAPVRQPAPRGGRSAPAPAPVHVPVRHSDGPAAAPYSDPVQLQTQADIAVALTAALSTRMKPPAAPRRDLRPSTAVWMLLTGLGVALMLLAVFNDPGYRWPALVAGAIQIGCGYAWIVRLTHMRDPQRGLACAIPPLTLLYLAQYKYAKFRPLRFVATGAALVGLASAAPALHTAAKDLAGAPESVAGVPDPAEQSKLKQLRVYRERQAYDPLIQVLDLLAMTDPLLSEDAKDRSELAAELKALCQHVDVGVKVRAMAAYARWDPDAARGVCLAAVRSAAPEEREWALRLLPKHWKDAESARAVQSLIARPGTVETNRAKAALEEIGGPPAEQAAIALFNRAEDQSTKLAALEVLQKVGGREALAWVRSNVPVIDDKAVRDQALAAAEKIEARMRPPAP